MVKYELVHNESIKNSQGTTVYRIRALVDIPKHDIKAGDLGGWIEGEWNLSQDNACWAGGYACVSGSSRVSGGALVAGRAAVDGCAKISGDADYSC